MSAEKKGLKLGQSVSITKIDHAGAIKMSYTGQVVCVTTTQVVVQCPWPTEDMVDLGGLVIGPGDQFLEYYMFGEPFNVFAIYGSDGRLKGWYCNVTRPVEISGAEIRWHDLVLDLLVLPDKTTSVLDEDELTDLSLPKELVRTIRAALERLCQWAEAGGFPFDGSGSLEDAVKRLALHCENGAHETTPLKHILVLRVPRSIEVRIEDAFLGLAGTTKPVMGYHITLVGPFYPMPGSESVVLGQISVVCGRSKAPQVQLTGLGAFQLPDNNTSYLIVEHSDSLLVLQVALQSALHEQIVYWNERARDWNTKAYHPHVTLGIGLTDEELQRFMSESQKSELDESFWPERVCLLQEAPNGAWQLVSSFAFQDTANSTSFDPHCTQADEV